MSGAVLICTRPGGERLDPDVWVSLPTREAAVKILTDCGPGCANDHLLCWTDDWGETHVRATSRPDPPPLAEQLARLYPRGPDGPPVERWPAPPEFNEALVPVPNTSPLPEREQHAAQYRATAVVPPEGRPIQPLPGRQGLAGVAARPPPPRPPAAVGYGPTIAWRGRTCEVEGCTEEVFGRGRKRQCKFHFWLAFPPMLLPVRRFCSVTGCHRVHLATGLCRAHYGQMRRGGPLRPVVHLTDEERYWSKVTKDGDGGCWHWTGCKITKGGGYGVFKMDGEQRLAHYFAYEWLVGEVPHGYRLTRRPTCPPHCVNPAHWRLTTAEQMGAIQVAAINSRRRHRIPPGGGP
jgi:hypothetical protein